MLVWDVTTLEALLYRKPVSENILHTPLLRNIAKSVQGLEFGMRQQIVDLTFGIKQALDILQYQAPAFDKSILLKAPNKSFFPTRSEWEDAGIFIYKQEASTFFLGVEKWKPSWLKEEGKHLVSDSYKKVNRRYSRRVNPDPYLIKYTHHNEFSSTAQRDAMRAILSMPDGATLGIAIPTGAGKSLCAWLPPLITHGLAIVIVPTVALALDQEKSVENLFNYPTAYQGGQDTASIDKRRQIRENIKRGNQRIVFTSPENILGSLFQTLNNSATSNKLTHFVIDEAHMVYEWGNDFRSSFQSMAGIWRTLLQSTESRLKTVFLSATYTGESKRILEILFTGPRGFAFWSSLKLREEPSFWLKKCTGEIERGANLLEAIKNVPRPLIIYTTRVEDAKQIHNKIRSYGYSRVGILTGESTTFERLDLVARWRTEEVDIVVGTSAFGLGIDKGNVRTVIHACVPENIDRYYQEVGRGGRDGKACVSLVLYTQDDIETAKSLSAKKIITIENGWKRWEKMFTYGRKSHRIIEIDLRRRPDIDLEPGDYNENWNLKTLLLMVQAKMISFSFTIQKDDLEDHQQITNHFDHRKIITIEILDNHHFNEVYWKARIEEVRNAIKTQNSKGYQAMIEVIEGRKCVGNILRDFYQSQVGPVGLACGGCFFCRNNGLAIRSGILPTKNLVWNTYDHKVLGDLERLLSGASKIFVEYEKEKSAKNPMGDLFSKFMQWLAERGIVVFVVDKKYRPFLITALSDIETVTFIYTFEECIDLPPLPTTMLDFGENTSAISRQLTFNNNVPTVNLFPSSTRDSGNEHRLLRDMIGAPARIYNLKELTQNLGIV